MRREGKRRGLSHQPRDSQKKAECRDRLHYSESYEGCFLIAVFDEHVACGNTHEEIGNEVHKVTGHTGPIVSEAPDVTEWCGHVGHKRNHGKNEKHGDDSHHIAPFCRGCALRFYC